MFLRASTDYLEVVSAAEKCLRQLPIEFRRNGTPTLAEFEIISPTYFRVMIEPNRMPVTWNFLMPSLSNPKGTAIEILYEVDSEDNTAAASIAKRFLRALAKSLPVDPWKGLGLRDSAKEEKRWKELVLAGEL